ncbi:GntR family transcriptional regulator [Pseudaminobacter sp. NGMCC 1.201702]|uniref:GntR family transcriptional regulator n=1 Tax=Pseudaminobacter sp. NGMCC 1.201702 TaxID=3391825 RepID=UPI0039F0280A
MSGVLHEKIRREILRRVDDGTYPAGKPLPSTAQLAEAFGVSAITVKRALRDLQTTGVLRAVAGLGTFVRERSRFIRDLGFSFNSLEDARRLGLDVTIQLLSISNEKAKDPAFAIFDPPDRPMLCIRRVISIGETAVMHDTSYLPVQFDEAVMAVFASKLIMEALEERDVHFTTSKLLIDAAPASRDAQEVFEIPNGYPMLRRLYRLATEDPALFVLGIAASPFDRLACTVDLDLSKRGRTGPSRAERKRNKPDRSPS